jgi:hypothetical protein
MKRARRHLQPATVDHGAASFVRLAVLVAMLLPAPAAGAQGVLENPSAGAVKSGVGVLSGWKCTAASATSITLTIDGGTPLQAAYGTARDDTTGTCGSANNGFGVLFNFGLLPEGQHEIVAADAGSEFARTSFVTGRLGSSFVSGARGVSFIRDFPTTGQGAFMVWQQGSQSFVIGGTCGSDGHVVCPPILPISAWTYADQETTAGPYTSATESASTANQDNPITRTSAGVYAVRFSGLASGSDTVSGVVHVTARQGNANFCVVKDWNPQGSDRVADVLCYDSAGNPADTRFEIVLTRPAFGNEVRGFLWADSPTEDAYTPDLSYQYNAAGPLVTVEHFSTGMYRAYLPGLATDDTVGFMLSAYGNDPRRCRVLDAGMLDGSRFAVDVACEDAARALADSQFTLSVINRTSLAAMGDSVLAAYIRTRDPDTAEVGPDETYNSMGGINSASHTATGRYSARFGGFSPYGAAGNVHVTAVGDGASHCTIEGVSTIAQDVAVVVDCFDGATPANSEFMLTYTR